MDAETLELKLGKRGQREGWELLDRDPATCAGFKVKK